MEESEEMITEQELLDDIKFLIGHWFSALEDEGSNPWGIEECVNMANKYRYTKEDYRQFLKTIC